MATTEERMKILKMIDEGKISAADGASLLAALSSGGGMEGEKQSANQGRRWLRIRVTDTRNGRNKANVNIPVGLLDAGLRIGAHFAPEVSGVDLDELRSAVRSGLTGKIIDVVDDDGEHVEIFVD